VKKFRQVKELIRPEFFKPEDFTELEPPSSNSDQNQNQICHRHSLVMVFAYITFTGFSF
jgi:hypothetical protein